MDTQLMSSIITLVAVLLLIGLVAYIIFRIRQKSREFAQMAFGKNSIIEGFKEQQTRYENTPKSLAAQTTLALERISKDFPEFNYDNMKSRAENVVLSFLRSIDEDNASTLSEGNAMLKEQLRIKLETLRNINHREQYDEAQIRRTEISRYEKGEGRCLIRFQCAVQSKHYELDDNKKIVKGSKDHWEQSRWEIDLVYIQDINKLTNPELSALGLNCPNCGAPITSLGQKACDYCGTAVREINIHAWSFSGVRER